MMHESLARKLRVLRAARGITLAQAEELTGVTRETLGALEHGQRGAYTSTLEKIADGYGTTVSAMLEEEPAVPLAEVSREAGHPEFQAPRRITGSWPHQYAAWDSWVKVLQALIKDYEPLIRDLPEKPSAEEYKQAYTLLAAFLNYAKSINDALMQSDVVAAYNELRSAVNAGETVPQNLREKGREFEEAVDRLNSKLAPAALDWLRLRGEIEELHSDLDKHLERWRQEGSVLAKMSPAIPKLAN